MPSVKQRHLFVIDPIDTLNPTLDSSLRMMYALSQRGHSIEVCQPKDLAIRSHSEGDISRETTAQTVTFGTQSSFETLQFSLAPPQGKALREYHGVHMRKDPPFDLDYITTVWLLDELPATTRVYNRPEALLRYNEKILITHFPEAIAPLLVSANPEKLLHFIEAHHDIILKPLHLFGGRGVIRLSLETQKIQDIRKILLTETNQGQALRLAQPFNQKIVDGEIRVFSAFGKPLAWCLKKPKSGNFLANTRAGATLHPFTPSDSLRKTIARVSEKLLSLGITLIGFDVIGELISEINLTSPRLLLAPGAPQEKIYGDLAALFEADV
jgi:glutathione synthase